MKKYTYLVILLLSFSCSSDYFDVNTPYNATDKDKLQMNDLLGPTIYHTVTAQFNTARIWGNYTQYFTAREGVSYGATNLSGAWSEIYLYALPNLATIIEKSEQNKAIHFNAIAKILTAINLGLATDNWDNIPYSEAFKKEKNLKPKFDSQQEIYATIDRLLAEAIASLETTDNSSFKINASSDLIYKGDTNKWLKAAYTLRARYKMHLTQVNGVADMNAIISYLSKGFSNNDDDLQMSYTDKNINPWYSRQILSAATGNPHDKVGDQLVSYMNGTDYPFSNISIDPRLPIYAVTEDKTENWKGYVSGGDGLSSDGEKANTNFADGGFYTNKKAPIVIISYAEACFLKAEALFLKNGGSETSIGTSADSYNAYLTGISANMKNLGVSSEDYIAEASIAVGDANLKLEHIMKEKYIANFLNPETFVDLRRYDFSTNIFKNLALPLDNGEGEFAGKWLVRATYPSTEESRNPKNVNANKKSPIEPVWWDR